MCVCDVCSPNDRGRSVEEVDNTVCEVKCGNTESIRLYISKIPDMSLCICLGTMVLSERIEMCSSRKAAARQISELAGISIQ